MDVKKYLEVVARYRAQLEQANIPKQRIELDRLWDQCSKEKLLAHAHFLLDGIEEYAQTPGKEGKTGRHLGSVQTILMVCGWQTLRESMDHNRPDAPHG